MEGKGVEGEVGGFVTRTKNAESGYHVPGRAPPNAVQTTALVGATAGYFNGKFN
jgi:hypothetical protein